MVILEGSTRQCERIWSDNLQLPYTIKLEVISDQTGQDRTGQDRTGQDRTGQDRTGQGRAGQDRIGQDRTGQTD